MAHIGRTTNANKATIRPVSQALVSAIINTPPASITVLRSAIDTLVPTKVCTKVVSAVSRDNTSPTRKVSKNSGGWVKTVANTRSRISATTRSPSQLIR